MRSNFKRIGDYVQQANARNDGLIVTNLQGVSINKQFMPSVANVNGTDLSTYKVVAKEQFAFNPMHVGRDEVLPIAMLDTDEPVIVSPAYVVFEIIDKQALMPEYLMMWCRRPEFDRNAWFTTDSSVRGSFSWDDFCEMTLPVPSPEKQREIVKEYHTIVDRIKLNDQLNRKLEETAQAIYKQWFVDFEFPISAEDAVAIGKQDLEGQPYKSSGGEMVYNEVLKQEIPRRWGIEELQNLAKIKGGKRLPAGEQLISQPTPHPYIKVADMGNSKFVCLNNKFEYLTIETQKKICRYIVNTGDLIISIVGTIGTVNIVDKSLAGANLTENCAKISGIKKITSDYLYHYLYSKNGREEIEMRTVGGVQGKLPLYNIGALKILVPDEALISIFSTILKPLSKSLSAITNEIGYLSELLNILLARISRVQ